MKTLSRVVGVALAARLRVMPAVVVTGARQTGKSTLAEQLVAGKRRYATLDDLDFLDEISWMQSNIETSVLRYLVGRSGAQGWRSAIKQNT